MTFLRVLLYCAFVFVVAAVSYVGGRIILPAMGLIAPHYWTWFWFYIAMLVLYAAWAALAIVIASLSD